MPWSHFLRCPSRWVGDLICIHHPAAHQPHWDGTVVALGNLGITGLMLICKWGIANTSSNHRPVAPDIGGGTAVAGLPLCDVSGPGGTTGTSAILWWCPDRWAIVVRQVDKGTEVALRCSFYRAMAAVLPTSCHCPMSAPQRLPPCYRGVASLPVTRPDLQNISRRAWIF